MTRSRKTTTLLLDMIEVGMLDPQTVVKACLSYMSEADVADMAQSEGFIDESDNQTDA